MSERSTAGLTPSLFSEDTSFVEQIRAAQGRLQEWAEQGYTPSHLTVCLSRETGSRGATIARKVAQLLNWDFYDQEKLEYLAQEAHLEQELWPGLPEVARTWAENHLQQLIAKRQLSDHPSIRRLAQALVAIGCRGRAVILGRGAGYLLPVRSTLLVRVVAPLADRIRYMSEFLRLTEDQARDYVHKTDQQRMEFVITHFGADPNDVHQYDLVINSSFLGVEAAAQVIVTAARYKDAQLRPEEEDVGEA
ncbi:MAG: cytidylate kinase-like family protein [Gemmatales bacterium]|nr:cytidylate kinase-like family protein [Gemmatales bacterium]MDW7993790.1 cytidylate kinase-like family protein [Gemmatales bacterium]